MDRAKDAESELECFNLFMDPSIIADMTVRTNKRIYSLLESFTPAKRAKMKTKNKYAVETCDEEVKAYLGLAFLRGYFQWNYWSAKKVWKSHPLFPATMTLNRFVYINRHITLDEIDTREERWKLDRFTAVREIFERFNENCGTALQMGEYGAIDECQYATMMQVSFKTYNPSKPAKYGILFKCINEVKMPFTHRSEPFAGKPSVESGEYYLGTTEAITLRLIDKVAEKQDMQGRNISMDNLYTSIPPCQQLLDRGMTLVGTMRHNRVGLPKEVKSLEGRETFSTQVWWEKEKQKMTLTSYVVPTKSKGMKNVVVLSSQQPILGVTMDDEKYKPQIIKFYDFSKGTFVFDDCKYPAAHNL